MTARKRLTPDMIQSTMPTPHDPGGKSRPKWSPDSTITATWSPDRRYRYTLEEIWNPGLPVIMWLLMNPSVATIENADPTLIRTSQYSRAWGYGGQLVGNVHSYRATDKQRLLEVEDPVGPGNDKALVKMARRAGIVMLAYGQPPKPLRPRSLEVVGMLRKAGADLHHLRLSKDGSPYHPLYLPANLLPIRFTTAP